MALDAGMQQFTVALDLTGANSAIVVPVALTNYDVAELDVAIVTASGADTVAVQFRQQITPTGTAGGTQIGVVTGPAATIVAAGKIVRKYVNFRINKGDRVWATVTDTTTGATDAVVGVKLYPAGESGAEPDDIASTT